jgi:hypothetical protein
VRLFLSWLSAFGELSHDPHDLWATSLGQRAKRLYYWNAVLGAPLVAPFVALDVLAPRARSIVVSRARFPIADAHYALGLFALARAGDEPRLVDRGRDFLAALAASQSKDLDEPAWGYPFDWPSRYGTFEAGTPLVTTVPYCYEAFESGYSSTGEERYLGMTERIARFVFERIPVTPLPGDSDASAYTPSDRTQVVNASAYRAALLASAGRRFDREDWTDASQRNVRFVLGEQRADGSWPYAADDHFVDNFHTCLVLKNLTKVWRLTADERVHDAVLRGYEFYLRRLLDDDGLPVPFASRPRLTLHRRDLYDYAEGVYLAYLLHGEVPAAKQVLERLVDEVVSRWQLPDGHFATRELVVGRNTVPYHRWAQAQMFHALARVAGSQL